MFRSRTAVLCVYWIAATIVVLAAMFWSVSISRGAIADCMDATCRITVPGGGRGTGCVFEINHELVYVLTAGHVVGEAQNVQCEFWRQGHQSQPLAGRVTARSVQADAAVVAVAQSAFGGALPAAVPLAPRDYVIRPGETLTSVGCANGGWSTGWKGHALKQDADELRFVPTPANGRSGSAIFDAEGQHILAIVRARTMDDAEGIATPVAAIYRAFDVGHGDCPDFRGASDSTLREDQVAAKMGLSPLSGSQAGEGRLTQCGPAGCPTCPQSAPRGSFTIGIHREQPSPYPTLPPVDVKPLDDKLGRITQLLSEIKADRAAGEKPSAPATNLEPAPDPQARKTAQEALDAAKAAQAETAKLAQATEGLASQVKDVTGQTNRLSAAQEKTAEAIQRHGTLGERLELLKQRVDEKVGEDASKPEKVRAFVHEAVTDKTEWLRLGLIVALVLPLLIFIIDYMHHKKTGDPLLVEKLAVRLGAAATHQPWLVPAANIASHAATDLLALLNHQHAQAQAQKPTTPAPPAGQ